MKFLKTIMYILILIVIIGGMMFLWRFLQKKEIIVTNATKTVISKLETINKLESAEMTITKIMKAEKEMIDIIPSISFDNVIQDALFQDKMIFEVEGKVVAGVDFGKLVTGDVFTDIDGEVKISLPKAEILHIVLSENTKPYDRKIGIFSKGNVEMETKLRNTAKAEMEKESIEAGILDVAMKNAKENLEKLFENIDIKVKFNE